MHTAVGTLAVAAGCRAIMVRNGVGASRGTQRQDTRSYKTTTSLRPGCRCNGTVRQLIATALQTALMVIITRGLCTRPSARLRCGCGPQWHGDDHLCGREPFGLQHRLLYEPGVVAVVVRPDQVRRREERVRGREHPTQPLVSLTGRARTVAARWSPFGSAEVVGGIIWGRGFCTWGECGCSTRILGWHGAVCVLSEGEPT